MKFSEVSEKFYMRKNSSRKNLRIMGYASVFDFPDSYNDIITMGSFDKSLKNPKFKNIKLLWQHDECKPIGIIHDIYEDHYGLFIDAEVTSKTQAGMEAIELILQQAVTGLSIGFNIIKSSKNDSGQRIITEIDLWEVSVVTFPANKESFIINFNNQETDNTSNIKSKKYHELENVINTALLNINKLKFNSLNINK